MILNWLDWRWLFYVNVPFCVVGFLLAWKLLPADPKPARRPMDVVGLVLLSPGIVGVLYGLSNASRTGGFVRPDVYAPMLIGVALLLAFVIHARSLGQRALVDVRLFAQRAVASASALLFLSGAALYGAMLLLPLYFQDVRGVDALGAGLPLVPQGLGTFASRSLAGGLTDTFGARWVSLIGFVIVGAATIPFALATASTDEWILMSALVVRGFGLGAVTIPLMSAAYVGLDRPDVPHASIITRIAQQVGGSFGVALLAVILDGALAAGTGSPALAFDQAFWWLIGFTGLAGALSLALPGRPGPVAGSTRSPASAVARQLLPGRSPGPAQRPGCTHPPPGRSTHRPTFGPVR